MKILVTGGAGYIGGFMVKKLLDDGNSVVVVDSLERSDPSLIDHRAEFKKGNLLDKEFIENIFSDHFDGVMHFAAYISMAESMKNPGLYFLNNVQVSLNILEEMRNKNLNNFIFSSTAGVYGNPVQVPIPEDHPKNPTNPYGESKLMVEKILKWYETIFGLRYAVLRYFNAAGAAIDGSMGERHNPETHLIPKAIEAAMKDEPFNLYGSDYDTQDGTTVRDYIHVLDLVEAHMLALNKIKEADGSSCVYNIGTGHGYSSREVVKAVGKISGKNINVKEEPRRPGDADTLVADSTKIKTELGFSPKYSDLETIVKTAWDWHKNKPKT